MFNSITMPEFLTLKNILVVDVRENDEYASGHIPNSIHIPLYELENRLNELDKSKKYYMVCYSGSRSQHACMIAANKGYNVINVMGGMSTYKGVLDYEM